MAFNWRFNLSGGPPLVMPFQFQDTETLTKGDLVNVNAGEIDLGATNDAGFAGEFLGAEDPADESATSPGTVSGTDSTTWGLAIINPDAVYGVADGTTRLAGANLDIAGATGAMTVATDSNSDIRVVKSKKAAADETLVIIAPGEHYLAE